MRLSTIALLTVSAIIFSATAVRAEEPERVTDYSIPESNLVPLSLSAIHHEALVADGEKSLSAKIENSVIHIDDNNRLVGLSN